MKDIMAKHNKIGSIGESIASNWLKSKGFTLVIRNYRKKYGEIDIIARQPATYPTDSGGTNEKVHFVEVKTVSYETKQDLEWAVSYETWRPEENVHRNKQLRLSRIIQAWIFENKYDGVWQVDIVTVRVVPREKYARVNRIENIIFE